MLPVHPHRAVHPEGDVRGVLEDAADRVGDVLRVEARGGYLVEERLEEMVVVAIDERHLHRLPSEPAGGLESPEACPDDHHALHRRRRGVTHRRDPFALRSESHLRADDEISSTPPARRAVAAASQVVRSRPAAPRPWPARYPSRRAIGRSRLPRARPGGAPVVARRGEVADPSDDVHGHVRTEVSLEPADVLARVAASIAPCTAAIRPVRHGQPDIVDIAELVPGEGGPQAWACRARVREPQ